MKKPDVKLTDEWTQTISVHTESGDSMYPFEIKTGYEAMMDALISINESQMCREVMGSVVRSKLIKALEQAGVEL